MKKVFIIFFLALAVYLVFFTTFAVHEGTFNLTLGSQDSGSFINDARNVYEGRGFSDRGSAPYVPDGIRVPVVPIILGLFEEQYGWYVLLQIVAASVSVLFLYRIGERVFGPRVALWAAVLFALDPLSAFHSITILSETWFTFFLLWAVWLLIQYRVYQPVILSPDSIGTKDLGRRPQQKRFARFLAALGMTEETRANRILFLIAFFLAIATLTRPVGIVLVPVFLAAMLFVKNFTRRQRVAGCVLFVVVFGAVLSPWLHRNYRAFGTAGLSYIPAYNWYHFNARLLYADQHGISKEEAKDVFRQWEDKEVARLDTWRDNGFALQPFYMEKSWEIIRQSLGQYLVQHSINTAAVFLNFGEEDIIKAWTGRGENINFTSYVARGFGGIIALAHEHPGAFVGKMVLLMFYGIIMVGVMRSFYFVILNLFQDPESRNEPDPRGNDNRNEYVLFFAFLILALTATTGAVAEPRFRVPAEPFILLLFVYSLMSFSSRLRPQGAIIGYSLSQLIL